MSRSWKRLLELNRRTPAVFDALMEAGEEFGIVDFGMRALLSMRLEKNFPTWFRELRPIYGPFEGSMDRFIRLEKNDFVGREAAAVEHANGPKLRRVSFVVDALDADVMGDEPIWAKVNGRDFGTVENPHGYGAARFGADGRQLAPSSPLAGEVSAERTEGGGSASPPVEVSPPPSALPGISPSRGENGQSHDSSRIRGISDGEWSVVGWVTSGGYAHWVQKSTHARAATACLIGIITLASPARPAERAEKPVLLYSRCYNAEGENRYLPDGTYKEVLRRLRDEFNVRIHNQPLTRETLAGVGVVLVANPSDKAVGANPPPRHVTPDDVKALTEYVVKGGGLIVMGNQENHNLEVDEMNKLLAHFGLQFTNLYTDAKKLAVPKETPVIGGLNWAYYTGNLLLPDISHPAKPRALVTNDLNQKPVQGTRDQAGCLLATAEPGAGRVVLITDSGWITDMALDGRGIGDVAIQEHDNWEIFRRLSRWAAHLPETDRQR